MPLDLIPFFLLTYAISWLVWCSTKSTEDANQILFWVAGFAPTIVATILTFAKQKWQGVKQLFRIKWRSKPIWYLIALLATPLTLLLALGINILLGGSLPRYVDAIHMIKSIDDLPMVIIIFLYIFFFTAVGEEFGWRAYALPRLQMTFSPFFASLILGVVWGLWHLPLFGILGDFHQQLPISWFILQVLGTTFIFTWLYNQTNGNIMISLIFHTSTNFSIALLPIMPLDNNGSLTPLWIAVGLLWIMVFIIIRINRIEFFLNNQKELTHTTHG